MFKGRLASGEQFHGLPATIKGRFEDRVTQPWSLSEPKTDRCDRCHRVMGLVGICFLRWDDAVTIPDYVSIGLLAVCLMLWAGTVLLARKS